MRLQRPTEKKVLQAIQDSFNGPQIAVILRRELGLRIDHMVGDGQIWPMQVITIYDDFHLHNTVETLLAALRDARPAVPEFAQALDELGFAQIHGDGVVGPPALEALLSREQSPYQDVAIFRGDLSKLETQVCQVVASLMGTGSLIAPDLVLTNRHVISGVLAADGRTLTAPVRCVFDKKKGGSTYTTPETTVKATVVEASSPHADEDTRPGPMNNSLNYLDYALLRLDQPLGNQPITAGGEARGTMDLTPPSSEPNVNSGMVVLQHPGGQPMKIDIGAVLARGPTRLRHSVNTEPGSSGAPVFDAALKLVAIHHSGHKNGPAPGDPGYNQAIPLSLILADARSKGVEV